MASMHGIDYRRAELADVFPLMKLYQIASTNVFADPLLLDYRAMQKDLESPKSVWIVADDRGSLLAAMSIQLDRENRLAKINRLLLDPAWEGSSQVLHQALPLLVNYLGEKGIEVLYTTTRTLSLAQQQLTLKMGFEMLGIFPNAQGADPLKLNGLTAYFFGDVLRARRRADHGLHPKIAPLYELVRESCGLEALPATSAPDLSGATYEALPRLETIFAPDFVAHRFEKLKERKSLSTTFYPFQEPNALLSDPGQRVEIFVKLVPERRFAAILGERLDLAVNPTELYHEVALMLNARGISFIEVLSDAADVVGLECMTQAGFVPCVYFPAFKHQGDFRRDYIVLARAFERVLGSQRQSSVVHPQYLKFLQQYYRVDEQIHMQKLHVPV